MFGVFFIIVFGLLVQQLTASEAESYVAGRHDDSFEKDSPLWMNQLTHFDEHQDGMHPSSIQNVEGDQHRSGRILGRLSTVIRPLVSTGIAGGNIDGNTLSASTSGGGGGTLLNPLANFSPCVAGNGVDQGICLTSPACSYYGGRSAGGGNSCRMVSSCCVNEVSQCGSMISLNNTYWQSPAVSSTSTCGIIINLNPRLTQQKQSICQIRLDFINFAIAQPNSESVCNVDSFQVIGATNKVPVICGDNNGQHMYLFVSPNSAPTNVQLIMSFGASTISRSWRIKIGLLACDTDTYPDYLAPDGCLQYFTASSGIIQSFNWKDTAAIATRQLANQDYNICFRTELVRQATTQVPTTMCLFQCQVSAGISFSLSGTTATSQSLTPTDCSNDYMVFTGGYQLPITTPLNPRDRFCGNVFAQGASTATPDTICSTAKSFRVVYKTNGDETITAPQDANTVLGNQGFCLQYQQRLS